MIEYESSKPARDEHGRLLPGHSGNPHGRPLNKDSITHLMRVELQNDPQRFIEELKELTFNREHKAETRLEALKYWFNRVDGTPRVTIDTGQPDGMEFLQELRAQMLARMAGIKLPSSEPIEPTDAPPAPALPPSHDFPYTSTRRGRPVGSIDAYSRRPRG